MKMLRIGGVEDDGKNVIDDTSTDHRSLADMRLVGETSSVAIH
jgi:hypothetical protein